MARPGTSRWLVAVLAAAVALAILVVVVVVTNDDEAAAPTVTVPESSVPVSSVPDTTSPDSTVSVPASTVAEATEPGTTSPVTTSTASPATVPPAGDVGDAVWPWTDSEVRYTNPIDAARGFAVEFVGFTDPIVGDFLEVDPRSGEVEVRSIETFAPTVVQLRQLGSDDTWWVTGSTTENIDVDVPEAGSTVSSPLTLSGRSRASEGTVDVAIRADGGLDPLGETFVTGGAFDQTGPFEGEIEFTSPGTGSGALVLTTTSSDDGRIFEATVVRVSFAPS